MRQGEFLLLVVSDRIHDGVEHVAHWLNEQDRSSPFKFGLVELKFYALGDQRLVIPRTVLKTWEVSRHVVVVNIQPSAEVSVTARVDDDFRGAAGGKGHQSRSVKVAAVPLTKNSLLQLLHPEDRQAASRLIEQLEFLGFDQQGTPAMLKFGFTSSNDEYHSLVALDKSGVWVGPLKKDADLLGSDAMLGFRNQANKFAPFYRSEQLTSLVGFGSTGKYRQLEESAAEFAAFLATYRNKLTELLEPTG